MTVIPDKAFQFLGLFQIHILGFILFQSKHFMMFRLGEKINKIIFSIVNSYFEFLAFLTAEQNILLILISQSNNNHFEQVQFLLVVRLANQNVSMQKKNQ